MIEGYIHVCQWSLHTEDKFISAVSKSISRPKFNLLRHDFILLFEYMRINKCPGIENVQLQRKEVCEFLTPILVCVVNVTGSHEIFLIEFSMLEIGIKSVPALKYKFSRDFPFCPIKIDG